MAALSVIIPVFQSAATLERCVDSVLSQNVPDMEVILVNDGSTDGGAQLCDRLALDNPRVKVIHRENGGLSAARNSGIEAASGRWIAFADSDDELAPHTYSGNLEWLERNPGTDMLEFPVHVHYLSRDGYRLDFEPRTVSGSTVFRDWLECGGYNHCYAWNKIYRRSLFDSVRFPEGETFEDAAVCPSLVRNCRAVRYSDKGCYLYYRNGSGITASYTFKGQEPLLRHNLNLLEESVAMNLPVCQARLWTLCMNLLIDLRRCHGTDSLYIKGAAKRLSRLRPSSAAVLKAGLPLKSEIKTLCSMMLGPLLASGVLGIRKY